MPNILHLAPDDKFLPFVQKVFEAAFPASNRYRIESLLGRAPRFVTCSQSLEIATPRYWLSRRLDRDLQWCDCLVVHYMSPWFARAIAAAPPSVAVVWGAWGGDFYHLLRGYADALYLPETRRLMSNLARPLAGKLRELAERLLHATYAALLPRWDLELAARIDAVSMLPMEQQLLSASVKGFRARRLQLYYASVEDTLSKGPDRVTGRDILVGNSATPANNHADAFAQLARIDLGNRRIVVPLSYGDEDYAREVCRIGGRMFGSRFTPLRQFMPIGEFNTAIADCATVLMNHVRQQAFGTINAALYMGARVFLRPENPLVPFFRDLGVRLSEMPSAERTNQELVRPLDGADAMHNRQVLRSFFSFQTAVAATRKLADLVAEKAAQVRQA